MAGTFTGIALTQQNDLDGRPMAGALLYIYTAGGTTPVIAYQDVALTLPLEWPIAADAGGRFPMFFVADGYYRLRVTDADGEISMGGFDSPQVASIGPSSTGSSGGSVDTATIMQTGDVKWQPVDGTLTGWVRMNGRTIGSALSGASERANADTSALFAYIWNGYVDAKCPVSGGRGVSAAADFAANKTITLLDMRFKAPVGLDTMGASAAGLSTGATFSGVAADGAASASSKAASVGGAAAHALTVAELATHLHAATVTDPGHTHDIISSGYTSPAGGTTAGSTIKNVFGASGIDCGDTASATTGITVSNANAGSSSAHNNMPPFMTGTWYWKL